MFSKASGALLLAALTASAVTASPLAARQSTPRFASPSDNWQLQGCAQDGYPNFRVLEGAGYTSNGRQTIATCLAYCDSQGAAFAGLENGNQCFCSNDGLQNNGAYGPNGANLNAQNNDGCTTNCPGGAGQACGGPNRLQVYRSTKRPVPAATPVEGATYLGCYADNTNNRLLPVWSSGNDNDNSNEKCVASCKFLGYDLAGTEYRQECHCGYSSKVNLGPKQSGCSATCTGNPQELCGGNSRLTVYKINNAPSGGTTTTTSSSTTSTTSTTSTSTTSTTSSTTGPTNTATPGGSNPSSYTVNGRTYNYLGCYTDRSDQQGRALTGSYSYSNARTVEGCIRSCQQGGFKYSATEYRGECRCGNQLASFSTNTAVCNLPCTSNNGQTCGGNNAMSLYATA
ncbi:unnamed protein product [Parajaminaea phylloscopi]